MGAADVGAVGVGALEMRAACGRATRGGGCQRSAERSAGVSASEGSRRAAALCSLVTPAAVRQPDEAPESRRSRSRSRSALKAADRRCQTRTCATCRLDSGGSGSRDGCFLEMSKHKTRVLYEYSERQMRYINISYSGRHE